MGGELEKSWLKTMGYFMQKNYKFPTNDDKFEFPAYEKCDCSAGCGVEQDKMAGKMVVEITVPIQ